MAVRYKIKEIRNKSILNGKPCYAVTLVTRHNTTLDEVAEYMNELSSFSPGDVSGLIDNLIIILTNELVSGRTVTLDGLGTFSLSAELKKKDMSPEDIQGDDIQIKRICFKPAPFFKEKLNEKVHFQKLDKNIRRLR